MTERKNTAFDLVAQFMGRQNYIPIPVPFLQLLGDHTAAVFLSQVIYWSDRSQKQGGWFHKTHAEWQAELLLTPDQVRRCTRICGEFVEVKLKGIPAKNHYRVNREALGEALAQLAAENSHGKMQEMPMASGEETCATSDGESPQQDVENTDNKTQAAATTVRGFSRQQVARQTPQLITEPTTEPTHNLKDKKHLTADAAALAAEAAEGGGSAKTSQASPSQDDQPQNAGTQVSHATDSKEVPPSREKNHERKQREEAQAQELLDIWNAHCDRLPAAEALSAGRLKAAKRLIKDCEGDFERAAELLRDATREVACDDFWLERRYGLDNLMPSKVFGRAEAWRARPAARTAPPTLTEANAPTPRKEWITHE